MIHGRFQPLHNGHLEYLLAGAGRCDLLIVGITNPDPWTVKQEPTDPGRSSDEANPCTFYERYLMVSRSMTQAGVPPDRVHIVPFPHSFPERLLHYAPRDAVYLLTVYDEWGNAKQERFAALGLETEVMWTRTDKPVSGSTVREAIRDGRPWEHMVPPAVATVVRETGLARRISDGPRR